MVAIRAFQPTGTMPLHDHNNEGTFPLSATAEQEKTMATVMMTQLHDTQAQVRFNRLLLMGQNDRVTSTYPLNRNITSIGRSRRNHIQIKDPLVSVKHMTVSVSGNTCVVNDLDSSNGTFINGERLVGGRHLRDGQEIILGKSVLRFAARQTGVPIEQGKQYKSPVAPSGKNNASRIAAALLFLVLSTALVYMGSHVASKRYTAKQSTNATPANEPSRSVSSERESVSHQRVTAQKKAVLPVYQAPSTQASLFREALEDYSAGRLDSSENTLKFLSAAKESTSQALQAIRVLSMVNTVRKLHAQALGAQKHNQFSNALDYWDRLLIVDMELVGDRPSYFSALAERTVQSLSYEHALASYRSQNHKKARQLCNVILKINPGNSNALALLAKIDPKA